MGTAKQSQLQDNRQFHLSDSRDLPGYKLPFTPAGEAALKFNIQHTIDPESLCIVGEIPRHDASTLPFQLLQGADYTVFLYWYTTYRLIPSDGRKHTEYPDPSFFGEKIGNWDGDTFVIDSIAFKDARTWADENANPHSDQLHTIERWTGQISATYILSSPSSILSSIQNLFIIKGLGYSAALSSRSKNIRARKIT